MIATDPGSVADMASFCRTTGNELMELTKDGDVFRFLIKRARLMLIQLGTCPAK